MWLGAAFAADLDCLLLPWLVDHTARVCVGGMSPVVVAVVMVAADHADGAELHWKSASSHCLQPPPSPSSSRLLRFWYLRAALMGRELAVATVVVIEES